jgi:hypothetical protein
MQDRETLVNELRQTESALLAAVEGLSAEQIEYAPAGEWSIRQCAGHLALSEDEMYGAIKKMLAAPAQPGRVPHLSDDWVRNYGTDREQAKSKTSPSLEPADQWPDLAAAIEHFRASRARTIELALGAPEDLRSHLDERGDLDAWQYFLIAATHTTRHIRQIEELKVRAGAA